MNALLSRLLACGRSLRALVCAALLTAVAAPAMADDLHYVYIGDDISMHFTHYQLDPTSPYSDYWTTGRIIVELVTQSPLTAGTTLADVGWFRISVQSSQDLGHNFNIQTPLIPGHYYCCTVWQELSGGLNIGAVDSNGLPTDWNIWLQNYYVLPTGINEVTTISTSTATDSFMASNPIAYGAGGSGAGGGTWLLLAVPEPASYAFMLAGLALIGVWARRRSPPRG